MLEEYFWDRANATAMGSYLTRVEGRFIARCLAQYPSVRTILDVGGGSGRFALPLATQGYEVFVTDASMVPLRVLKHKAPAIPCARVDSVGVQLSIADGSVDCVLCIEVPALVDHARWFFPECRRILRAGGLLILTAHNRHSYKGITKRLMARDQQFYSVSHEQLRRRLNGNGFAIVREQGFNWAPVTRTSNSRLIMATALLEECLRTVFDRMPALSPWLLVLAHRR